MSQNFLADLFDPGNFFHDTESDRLSKEQWEWQKEKYDENFALQKEAYAYQVGLNRMQMEREDNAVQRRINDLKASGLSPTLAAGSSASATPVHAGTVPQYEVGTNPRVATAMFKEQMQKDRMALAMSVMGNIADVSQTKAQTELLKAKYNQQDIINRYLEDKLKAENEGRVLDNASKRMANNFNSLANPARLREMQKNLDIMDTQLKILNWDEKIKTNEHLRQIYYNTKARFESELAGQNVEIAKLRRENIDYDTALKAYSLVYASEHGVPLSGMNDWQAIYNLGKIIKDWLGGDSTDGRIPTIKPGNTQADVDTELLKYLLGQ